MSDDRLLSAREAAKRFGVSHIKLYAMVKAGEIPHHKFGDRIVFDVAEVLAATSGNAGGHGHDKATLKARPSGCRAEGRRE